MHMHRKNMDCFQIRMNISTFGFLTDPWGWVLYKMNVETVSIVWVLYFYCKLDGKIFAIVLEYLVEKCSDQDKYVALNKSKLLWIKVV